jgi:photosystem II stability/assembly factor-like uncharacterized protein
VQATARVATYLALALVLAVLCIDQRAVAGPQSLQATDRILLDHHYFSQDLILIYTDAGLFRATGAGEEWQQVHLPSSGSLSVGLGGVLYLYSHATNEIRRSADGGETWALTGQFPFTSTSTTELLSASPVSDTIFVVVGYVFPETGSLKGIYKSTDSGAVWTKVLDGPGNYADWVTFSPNFAEDGVAFVEFGDYKVTYGVWKTEDRGETWFHSSAGLPVGMSLTGHVLSISPQFAQDQTVFAVSDCGVYKSTDGGASWFEVGDPPGFLPNKIAVSPGYIHDQTLLTGDHDKGLFLSQDGADSWQPIDFAVSPRYVGIRHVGAFRPWPAPPPPEPPDPPGPYRAYLPLVGTATPGLEFWVVTQAMWPEPSRLYRSRDMGATWEEVLVFEVSHRLYLSLVGTGGKWGWNGEE